MRASWWLSSEESTLPDTRIPALGREDPGRRKWHPTPVFLPGVSHGCKEPGGLQATGSQSQTRLNDYKQQPPPCELPAPAPPSHRRGKGPRARQCLVEATQRGQQAGPLPGRRAPDAALHAPALSHVRTCQQIPVVISARPCALSRAHVPADSCCDLCPRQGPALPLLEGA